MTLEEQILRLEDQRERCLDELDDEIHAGMRHLRQRWSPARFFRRHLGPSVATAGIVGILLPWLAGKAWPVGHQVAKTDEAGINPHESAVEPACKSDPQAASRGSAGRLLSAVVRTAAVEVASRVDIPGVISRLLSQAKKPKIPEEKNE